MMDRVVRAVFAAAVVAGCGSAWAEDTLSTSAYVRRNLAVMYDAQENPAAAAGLVNLGSAGSSYDLTAVGSGDKIDGGWICCDTGWAMAGALPEASRVMGAGYTGEYVGQQTGGSGGGGYCTVISTMAIEGASSSGAQDIAIMLGSVSATAAGMYVTGLSPGWTYYRLTTTEGDVGSALATRSGVVDANPEHTTSCFENGALLVRENLTSGSAAVNKGIARVTLGNLRKGVEYYWKGQLGCVRIYTDVLSDREIAFNAAVDAVRYRGVSAASAPWPEDIGYRNGRLEASLTITYNESRGTVSVGGVKIPSGVPTAVPMVGGEATFTVTPVEGARFDHIEGVPWTVNPTDGTVTVQAAESCKFALVFAKDCVIPASAYIQNGLILHYDGIENAGAGQHDGDAKTWADLSGNNRTGTLSAYAKFTEDSLDMFATTPPSKDGKGQWGVATTTDLSGIGTIESYSKPTGGPSTARTLWAGYPTYTTLPTAAMRVSNNDTAPALGANSDCKPSWGTMSFNDFWHVGYVSTGSDKWQPFVNGALVANQSTTQKPTTTGLSFGGFENYNRTLYGNLYAVRIYNRALTVDELIVNANIDKARFENVDPATLTWPDGLRWNEQTKKIEAHFSVSAPGGTVALSGVEAAEKVEGWFDLGMELSFTVTCPEGMSVQKWIGGTVVAGEEPGSFTTLVGNVQLQACVGKDLRTWTGGGDGTDWFDAANWEPLGAPGAGSVVSLPAGKMVTLTNSTPKLSVLELAGTLATTNWETCVCGNTVIVANGGKVTVAGLSTDQATNRVWIVCDDCTIAAGGSIDVNDLGFRGSKDTRGEVGGKASEVSGPGKGIGVNHGASHGGHGGYTADKGLNKTKFQNVLPYDDPLKPLLPGSGGYPQAWGPGTAGGGAVYISAAKSVRVDGAIKASVTKTVGSRGSSGSGGAVLIECETFHGSGGSISADGGGSTSTIAGIVSDPYGGAAGGGGMIAIKYDPVKQTEDMIANMTISASSGLYDTKKAFGDETVRMDAGLGTVYFPDNKLLRDTFGRGLSGALINCKSYEHEGDFVFSRGYLRLASEGAKLKVNGNLAVDGKMTRLDIGGVTITNQCTVAGIWAGRQTNILEVAGALEIRNGGRLDLRAAETNANASIGAYLKVRGALSVDGTSTLSCWSDQVNMGSPFIEADSFRLDEGGLVTGFLRGCGPGKGLGGGKNVSGGSHGGKSGMGTWSSAAQRPYDDEYLPTMPGSGGGNGSWAAGGPGGGVVYISVAREATVNGTINVDGMPAVGSHTGGGGAGGTIQIRCRTFFGGEKGVLTAKGCDGLSHKDVGGGSGGGGGRIAIWCGAPWGPDVSRFRIKPFTDVEAYPEFFSFAMTTNVTGGVGTGGSAAVPTDPKTIADPGTVRFVYVRDKPGMRVLVR